MEFTRQPIIETVITPKEGCKLVIRSSKNIGQEEYFVDALEIISFGNALFYRSIERPKAFIVPVSDFEVLEVRETRMMLKSVSPERNIKIAGGKESSPRKEVAEKVEVSTEATEPQEVTDASQEKRRDKRRQTRRKRGREQAVEAPREGVLEASQEAPKPMSSTLLAPPPTLISETIARYKDNALFRGAFYTKDEEESGEGKESSSAEPHPEDVMEALVMQNIDLEPPPYSSLELFEEERSEPEQDKDTQNP